MSSELKAQRAKALEEKRRFNSAHGDWLYVLFLAEKTAKSTANNYRDDSKLVDLTFGKIYDVQATFRVGENEPASMADFIQMYGQTADGLLVSTNMNPPTERVNATFFLYTIVLWYRIQNGYPNAVYNNNFDERFKDDIAAHCNLRVLFGDQFSNLFNTPEKRLDFLYSLMAPSIGFDGCVGLATEDLSSEERFNELTSDELRDIVEREGSFRIKYFTIEFSCKHAVSRSCAFLSLVKECTNDLFHAGLWRYSDERSSLILYISCTGVNDVHKITGLRTVLEQMYQQSILKKDSLELMFFSFLQDRQGLLMNDFDRATLDYRTDTAIELRVHKEKVRFGEYPKEYYEKLFREFTHTSEEIPLDSKAINLPGPYSLVWKLINHYASFMGTEGFYGLGFQNDESPSLLKHRKWFRLKVSQHNETYNQVAAEVLMDTFGIQCTSDPENIYITHNIDNMIRYMIEICSCDILRRDQMINFFIALHQSQSRSVIKEYKDWCFGKWCGVDEAEKREYLRCRGFTKNEIESIFDHERYNDECEDDSYSFSFFFDDEYVEKFLQVVTQLPVFVHYIQVVMTRS